MTFRLGTLGFFADSDSTAKSTLRRMQHDVNGAIQDHEFVDWVRAEIYKYSPSAIDARNQTQIARAVRSYVADHIRFTKDPLGIENITPPQAHMKLLRRVRIVLGDCDDAATLGAAMGKSLGIRASFKILAFRRPDAPYQHVITYLHPAGGIAIDIDTTRSAQNLPPIATRSFEMNV